MCPGGASIRVILRVPCPRTYMLAELLGECLLKAHLRNLVIQNEGKHSLKTP
jgi:hypothetical protein